MIELDYVPLAKLSISNYEHPWEFNLADIWWIPGFSGIHGSGPFTLPDYYRNTFRNPGI